MNKNIAMALLAATLAVPAVYVSNASAEEKAAAPAAAAASTTVELKDGSKVEIDAAGKVWAVDKDGKKTPAADGAHETKDGKTINVKGGAEVK